MVTINVWTYGGGNMSSFIDVTLSSKNELLMRVPTLVCMDGYFQNIFCHKGFQLIIKEPFYFKSSQIILVNYHQMSTWDVDGNKMVSLLRCE